MTGRMGTGWARNLDRLLLLAGLTICLSCAGPGCEPMQESPMAFAPQGNHLAFTTVEPFHADKSSFEAGPQMFRLMTIADGKTLRILEEQTDVLLTAPGYSPDGQRLCYLRIPLKTAEQAQTESDQTNEKLKPLETAVSQPWLEWWAGGGQAADRTGTATTSQPSPDTQPAIVLIDAALPPVSGGFGALVNTVFLPTVTGQLVVRNASTGKVLSETAIELPSPDLKTIYMHTRPQFDPAGEWVYFATGQMVLTVHPAWGEKRVVAGKSLFAAISPDGKMLATCDTNYHNSVVGLIGTDGQTAFYRKVPFEILKSPAWIDNDSLAILAAAPEANASQPDRAPTTQVSRPEAVILLRLRRNGELLTSEKIVLPKSAVENMSSVPHLAIAPDGRHMVAGNLFMTTDDQVIRAVEQEAEMTLSQPTFSADSRQVAVKVLQNLGDNRLRAENIIFYSNEGKEVHRVDIPRIKPSATRASTTQHTPQ